MKLKKKSLQYVGGRITRKKKKKKSIKASYREKKKRKVSGVFIAVHACKSREEMELMEWVKRG